MFRIKILKFKFELEDKGHFWLTAQNQTSMMRVELMATGMF
jgi:hypothetical protein